MTEGKFCFLQHRSN